jgi:hypothetical protein
MIAYEVLKNCSGVVDGVSVNYAAGSTKIPFGQEIKLFQEFEEYGLVRKYLPSKKVTTKVTRPSKTK